MSFKWAWIVLPLLISCSQIDSGNYRSRPTDSLVSKEVAESVTIEYTDSGLKRALVKSPVMVGVKRPRNPYVEMPKGIKVDFFGTDGIIESYLTSEYAISYTQKKLFIARRKVEVLNIKGDTLLTEELVWDQNTGKIRSDKFVMIKTKTQIISGIGMESDQTFTDWEITNVTGTIYKSDNNND